MPISGATASDLRVFNCHPDPERSEGEASQILRGVYPERDSSVASLPQNDKRRRAQNDN